MAELGLPRSWAEFALRRTGGTIEAAVHFCLERGGDMERLLAAEQDRDSGSRGDRWSTRDGGGNGSNSASANLLIRQLLEMGFPSHWCAEALAATRNNVDDALTWILTNGERLSAQDGDADMSNEDEDDEEEDEEEEDDDDDEEDEFEEGMESLTQVLPNEDEADDNEYTTESTNVPREVNSPDDIDAAPIDVKKPASDNVTEEITTCIHEWSVSICPLRFVSGRSNIDPKTLEISGLPSGGFSSVGTKGVLLTSGKWYYEAELLTAGCLQIGWADGSFGTL